MHKLLLTAAAAVISAALAAAPAAAQTLEKIKQRGVLVVGSKADYKPFGFRDPSGAIVGFEPDIARLVAEKLGVKLELEPVVSSNRMQFLQQGKIDLMIDTVDRYAPNFKQSVLGRQIFSPLDLERTFGLIGGDIFHGSLDFGQMFSARPMLGHADYRGPLPGLYMCGSGTHPGGGVTGLPGRNAAREILRDLRRR